MNKRFLSTLLFGALFIASTSVFVSCKDYDDDIKNLQTQIDKAALKSDLDALQKTLANASTNAEAAMKNLEAKLQAELAEQAKQNQANADELQKQIDAVKAAADAAAKDLAAKIKEAADAAAAAQAAADKAQQGADAAAQQAAEVAKQAQEAANAALQEAVAKLNAENAELRTMISNLGTTMQSYVTAEELKAQIEELKNQIAHMDGAAEVTAAYRAAVDELYKAVTSVELIEAFLGYKYTDLTHWYNYNWTAGMDLNLGYTDSHHLSMVHGFVPEDAVFGNDELMYDPDENALPFVTYTKGNDIKVPAGIVVRVNPVNADISKGDVSLKLIDSQGYDLDGIVEFGTPYKYPALITRGRMENTGLWIIPVTVAKGVDEATFTTFTSTAAYGTVASGKTAWLTPVSYAVAINNTPATEANRYVTSTFDLTFEYTTYVPANHFTFDVINRDGPKSVNLIHNRWNGNVIRGEEYPTDFDNPEYAWAPSQNKAPAPTAIPVWDDQAKNYNVRKVTNINDSWGFRDTRYNSPLLPVAVNEPFTISNILALTEADAETPIDSIYVVLDKHNAVESEPSEINAWESYTYEGLNQTVAADKGITLKVTAPQADGDVIGFRVYAVNCDGSLVDPDGRAFYILVTNEPVDNSLYSTVTAMHPDGSDVSTVMDIKGLLNGNYRYYLEAIADYNENTGVYDPYVVYGPNASDLMPNCLDFFQFNFVNTAKKTTFDFLAGGTKAYLNDYSAGYNLNPAYDCLTITPKGVQNLVDWETYKFKLVGEEYVQNTWIPRKVTYIYLTKELTDSAKVLTFRPRQEGKWKNATPALNEWQVEQGSGKFMTFMVPNKEIDGTVGTLYSWSAPWATQYAVHDDNAKQVTSYEAWPRVDNGFKNLSNVFYNLSVNGQNGSNAGAGTYDQAEWDPDFEFIFKTSMIDPSDGKTIVDLARKKSGKWGKGEGILFEDPGYAYYGDPTDFRATNYKYMLDIQDKLIDGLTEHDVAVNYIWRGVSTTLDQPNPYNEPTVKTFAKDYKNKSAQTLKAIYACWHHANEFKWDEGTLNTKIKAKLPLLAWVHDGATVTGYDFKYLLNTNWYDPDFFGNGTAKGKTFETLFTNGWLADFSDDNIELNTQRDGKGQKNPYFVPTFDFANKQFVFTQKNTQMDAAPIESHIEYLRLKAKDVFDHDIWIVQEVKILKPGDTK